MNLNLDEQTQTETTIENSRRFWLNWCLCTTETIDRTTFYALTADACSGSSKLFFFVICKNYYHFCKWFAIARESVCDSKNNNSRKFVASFPHFSFRLRITVVSFPPLHHASTVVSCCCWILSRKIQSFFSIASHQFRMRTQFFFSPNDSIFLLFTRQHRYANTYLLNVDERMFMAVFRLAQLIETGTGTSTDAKRLVVFRFCSSFWCYK